MNVETAVFTTNDGVAITYDICGGMAGDNRPVVALHGWGTDARIFDRQCDTALSARKPWIVPDQRGHGRSATVQCGGRVARLSKDLEELLDRLGSPRVDLLGWSLGCTVIWSLIDLFGQDRIGKIVLVDEIPWVLGSTEMVGGAPGVIDVRPLVALHDRLAAPETRQARSREFIDGMLCSVTPEERAEILRRVEPAATYIGIKVLLDAIATDWTDLLSRIERPTLVVGGTASFFGTDFHHRMAGIIPDCRLEILEGGGHFLHFERPDWLNPILADFLDP
ncbi:MAG: alpha/beta hydrolase [Azospirillaceae bacterium]